MSTLLELPQAVLTTFDRCDRCSAQAMVRSTLHKGELLFCGHHAKEIFKNKNLTMPGNVFLSVYDPELVLSV